MTHLRSDELRDQAGVRKRAVQLSWSPQLERDAEGVDAGKHRADGGCGS
jgi:hypothetical protein